MQPMDVPRPEVKSVLHLPAYATARAMQDLRRIFDLHSSWQHRVLNPLSEARGVLKDTSWVHYS